MIRALLVIALTACGSRSQPPPSRPPPPPSPEATPAAAPPAGGPLYRYGKPRAPGEDDRYTCRASADQIATCTGACAPMPPVAYWNGELRCSGVRTEPPNRIDEEKRLAALAIPACQCSCDAGYKAAAAAYQTRVEQCAEVP